MIKVKIDPMVSYLFRGNTFDSQPLVESRVEVLQSRIKSNFNQLRCIEEMSICLPEIAVILRNFHLEPIKPNTYRNNKAHSIFDKCKFHLFTLSASYYNPENYH